MSVMRLMIGLSSFQHCQYSGTSRCTSEIRTKLLSASAAELVRRDQIDILVSDSDPTRIQKA